MNNKKEILLKYYVSIYRPMLEKEKKKAREERIQPNYKYDAAA